MDEPNTFFKDALDPKLDQVKKDLEGSSISSKLEAMKRLIAVIFQFLYFIYKGGCIDLCFFI